MGYLPRVNRTGGRGQVSCAQPIHPHLTLLYSEGFLVISCFGKKIGRSKLWLKILWHAIVQKSMAPEGRISTATEIRMLYAGKDFELQKHSSLFTHTQGSDLFIFQTHFPLSSGHLFTLCSAKNRHTQRVLFSPWATEMKSWGRKKKEKKKKALALNSLSEVKCEKTSSRAHSVTVAGKSMQWGQSPRPAAPSRPQPPWIGRIIHGERLPLEEMEFLLVFSLDYPAHTGAQVCPLCVSS